MKKVSLLSFALCVLLTACASASLPVTPTSSPMPSSTIIPTETPRPTATETATAVSVAMSEFGVTEQAFADQLSAEGMPKDVTGEKGNWQIGKVVAGYNKDGEEIVEQNVKIVSFARNYQVDMDGNVLIGADKQPIAAEDLHNPVTNNIVTGLDSQGKVVFWSESDKSWHRPVFSTDIDNMVYYKEGTQLPIESALLNPEINKPLTAKEIVGFKSVGLIFENDEKNNSTEAYIQAQNDTGFQWMLNKDKKAVWFTNGTSHTSIFRLQYEKDKSVLVQADSGLWGQPDNIAYFELVYPDLAKKNFRLEIASHNNHFEKHPFMNFARISLDSLLSIDKSSERLDKLGKFGAYIKSFMGRQGGILLENNDYTPGILDGLPKNIQNGIWGLTY